MWSDLHFHCCVIDWLRIFRYADWEPNVRSWPVSDLPPMVGLRPEADIQSLDSCANRVLFSNGSRQEKSDDVRRHTRAEERENKKILQRRAARGG